MMERPHDISALARNVDHRDAHQRRVSQIEPTRTVAPQKVDEPVFRLALRNGSPVMPLERHFRFAHHDLKRRIEPLEHEQRAENVVRGDRPVPGPAERGEIEGTVDRAGSLVDMHAARRIHQTVKQHALLHGRQRIDVGDLVRARRQPIELERRETAGGARADAT